MKQTNLFKQGFYKKATADYMESLTEINKMVAEGQKKRSYISDVAKGAADRIKSEFNQGYETLNSELSDKLKDIKQKYESERAYSNPSEEILKRQDFDLRISLMDDHEVNALVKDALENNTLSLYEVSVIQLSLKQGQLKDSSLNNELTSNLIRLTEKYSIGAEWEKVQAYIDAYNLMVESKQMNSAYLWIGDDNGEYNPIDIKQGLFQPLKNYS